MSDENISIDVTDDGAIDAYIAKLDEALAKSEQLTGQTPQEGQFYTIPSSEMAEITKRETTDFYTIPNTEMDELNAKAAETQANVDDVVSESEQKLDFVKAETDAVKDAIADAVADADQSLSDQQVKAAAAALTVDDVSTEIKGLESASSRVIRMIPGLREAQRIHRSIGMVSEGSVMGVLGLLMVAYSIYRQISSMLEEQKQQQAEYKKTIMDVRGFTTSAQFTQWQENQSRLIEGYRLRIIP